MRMLLFCAILASLCSPLQAQVKSATHKFYKNHVEIGTQAVNFIDGNGFHFSESRSRYNRVSRTAGLALSYSRILNENWMIRARYYRFNRQYQGPYSDNLLGILTAERWCQGLSTMAAYTVRNLVSSNFKLQILVSGDIHLRHISENVYAESQRGIPNCFPRNDWYNNYDMGIGSTIYANVVFRNRITLGADLGYGYYGHLAQRMVTAERRTFEEVKPNSQTATLGIRLGMLF